MDPSCPLRDHDGALRRVGVQGERRFERIGWDEAFERVASGLARVVAEHGGHAVLPYSYMPRAKLVRREGIEPSTY